MTRDLSARLLIDNVSPETKKALQEEAMRHYGKRNASLMVRSLIASHLSKSGAAATPLQQPLSEAEYRDTVRVELRLPRTVVAQLNELAEKRFSNRNYYLTSVILAHLGRPQLQGDEIEVLRRSNYELSKVGTNLNQVAKAFNLIVKLGGSGKVPEIGKKIASLRRDINEHTSRVLRLLNAGTSTWETPGQKKSRKKVRDNN